MRTDGKSGQGRGVFTTCQGCYSDCAMRVLLQEDNQLEVEMPVEGHPCRADRLCGRGKRRLALPDSTQDRVTQPLRRRPDGSFEPIGWDDAYREIADRLLAVIGEHGARSLALTTGVPSYYAWYAQRFLWALGSPNLYTADAACEASRVTAWLHTLGYSPESDLAHTDYIVYFGRSPMDAASVTMADEVARARERGAKVIVVDPRRNSTVDQATRWLKVRPGHDLAVLLGIAHVLIEEDLYDHEFVDKYTTGFDEFAAAMRPYTAAWAACEADVSEQDILDVARELGAARPRALVDCGFHGGLGVAYVNSTQTSRMVALVDALLGSYGKPGGSLAPERSIRLGELDPGRFPSPACPTEPKVGADRHPLVDQQRGLCTTIGESIELGELHALIAYASNPATGYGNARDWMRMLSKLDLIVAVDIRLSETARIADYVLPEVTYLESDRGVGVSGPFLYYRAQAMPVLHPQTKPADRIFRELAAACGVGKYFSFTAQDLALAQVAPFVPEGQDACDYLSQLRERGFIDTGVELAGRTGEPEIATPDGKIAFASDEWARAGQGRTPQWMPPMVEPLLGPGSGEFRLIGGNNPFASHTSSHALVNGARQTGENRSRPGRDLEQARQMYQKASDAMAAVWLHEDRAAQLGICDGDIVEVSSREGSDRAVAHLTRDLHPAALFTVASPGARSGMHARARAAVAGELGVGPLDHTPLRTDRLSGAALTQENVVHVRRVGPGERR